MLNSADPEKLTDLDLHCLQKQGISDFSRTRVKPLFQTHRNTKKNKELLGDLTKLAEGG